MYVLKYNEAKVSTGDILASLERTEIRDFLLMRHN